MRSHFHVGWFWKTIGPPRSKIIWRVSEPPTSLGLGKWAGVTVIRLPNFNFRGARVIVRIITSDLVNFLAHWSIFHFFGLHQPFNSWLWPYKSEAFINRRTPSNRTTGKLNQIESSQDLKLWREDVQHTRKNVPEFSHKICWGHRPERELTNPAGFLGPHDSNQFIGMENELLVRQWQTRTKITSEAWGIPDWQNNKKSAQNT